MTRASDFRPTRRVLITMDGAELVFELRCRRISIRPLGARRGGPAEVELTPGMIYQRGLMARADQVRREKMALRKSRRRRG